MRIFLPSPIIFALFAFVLYITIDANSEVKNVVAAPENSIGAENGKIGKAETKTLSAAEESSDVVKYFFNFLIFLMIYNLFLNIFFILILPNYHFF